MRKKLFAILLAVMLALSLGSIAVFAEGDSPSYLNPDEENTFNLPIRYKINQSSSVNPETTLYFECLYKSFQTDPDDENPLSDSDMTFPDISVSSITFGAGEATLEGAVRNAVFTIPAISRVGIYKYSYAMDSDHSAVHMDYPGFTLRISVFNGPEPDSKQMAVGVLVMSDTPSVDPETGNLIWELFKTDELEIEYRAYEYSITKQVAGNLGDRDKNFDFTVKLAGNWYNQAYHDRPDHNEAEGYPHVTISYSGGSVNGSFNLEDATVTTPAVMYPGTTSEYTQYTHSFEKEITFSLKHGQTVTFTNIPETVTITTTEANYSEDGYVTTIDDVETATASYTVYAPEPVMNYELDEPEPVTDPDTGEIVYQYGNGSVTVVNTKEKAIDTGVILDNLPYIIAVVFVAACGIAFFVIRKRRRSDDSDDDEA